MKFYLITLLLICMNFTLNLNLKGDDEDDEKYRKIPLINIHMIEPKRDPIEVRRIEDERRVERDRKREVNHIQELDQKSFDNMIAVQNSQNKYLEKLDKNMEDLLNYVMKKNQQAAQLSIPPEVKEEDKLVAEGYNVESDEKKQQDAIDFEKPLPQGFNVKKSENGDDSITKIDFGEDYRKQKD
jgi:hypothetical protein